MKISISQLFKPFFLSMVCLSSANVLAQNSTIIAGQDPNRRVITTAVPFLNFAPDSRHSAMGDAGVATSPDANSAHWNAGKLAFIEKDMGFSLSYSPWLGRLVNDMSVSYLTGYKKIDENSAFGFDLRYFNMGDIQLTNERGEELGEFTPRDIAIGGTYSRRLSENLGLGISARFIHSNLSGNISSSTGSESRPGVSVGTDVGLYYTKDVFFSNREGVWSWGAMISNIGPKLTYNSSEDLDYIPTNFRIGTSYKVIFDQYNSLTFALDFNKLMVPTPPIYRRNEDGTLYTDPNGDLEVLEGKDPNRPLIAGMFGSFADAPGGFSEELQEFMISFGMEYLYDEKLALRTGYFHENINKGGRRYFTMGVGFNYKMLGFDFSYLVPMEQNHPLAETLRISLAYNIFNR
ncbi:type IX secretion system outer membrane channel protein PorV [Belliella kenyensis]|uniref:Type IX secretion system outer membrane channel protein PorV n=1 Tax=Belliella kenyensis TaxID=1472724 RepID=A0ABV8EMC2_9BACT|nr:type IX secretion system outer membrane channel protein PorV [Belliella kenyensis]MCH7400640.1 type IX secretion system outer membrane channel protein PorV [Belliella kenyensis]MDN3602073.1 type IX secretion system outer membrane channel protein PorV [Belliella kenyensis]